MLLHHTFPHALLQADIVLVDENRRVIDLTCDTVNVIQLRVRSLCLLEVGLQLDEKVICLREREVVILKLLPVIRFLLPISQLLSYTFTALFSISVASD